jgi:large subunit ribosomal protein L6
MSRIGKKPVPVPKGVTVTVDGSTVKVKGPRGELSREVHRDMRVTVDGATITVARPSDEPVHRALHGLTRTLVANMVQGVTAGFRKQLEIIGVGYKAETRPYGLQLALGFSHAVEFRAPVGIKLTAPQPTSIVVEGANKEIVGQVAAELRQLRRPEPYKGKGIKYVDEQVRRKAGKAGSK